MRTAITGAVLAGTLAVGGSAMPAEGSGHRQPAAAAATTAAAPYCGITWGSMPKSRSVGRGANLIGVTTERQPCWDRLTFTFDGPVDGYLVDFATQVWSEGAGDDLVPYTAGGAHLRVSVQSDARTLGARGGQHLAAVVPYRTLRDVVYGNSFEANTVFAVGVRARLPFRVTAVPGPGSHSSVVVDVAHRW